MSWKSLSPGMYQIFYVQKSCFHLGLAKHEKTDLSDDEERQLFASDDPDGGGDNLTNENICNPILLYNDSELGGVNFWWISFLVDIIFGNPNRKRL